MSNLLMSSRRHMTCLHLPALAQAAMTAPKAGRSADGNASSKSSNAKTHFLLSFLMKEHQNVKLVLSMFKTPPAKKRMKLKNKKQTQLSIFFQTRFLLYLQEWIAAVKVVSPGLWHRNFIARSHSDTWLQASTTVARDLLSSPCSFCSCSNKHST